MRLFVACPNCDRRYNASRSKIGTRFRCHCGQVLTVEAPRGHEAAVIRCSSCGGAREKGRNRCGYCGADFTIHERDVNTVCPKCMARVSDRARFCQYCGARMGGEPVMEREESSLTCPVCGDQRQLVNRRLGQEQVSVLECPFCAGLWLGIDSFMRLRDRVARQSSDEQELLRSKPRPAKLRRQAGPVYRHCVYCGKHMTRQQYAHGSGVVIDICRQHGIWFDADELQQTLAWIARGGSRIKNARVLRGDRKKEVSPEPVTPRRHAEPPVESSPSVDFLDVLVGGLFDLFT